jgi:hypothetical protein
MMVGEAAAVYLYQIYKKTGNSPPLYLCKYFLGLLKANFYQLNFADYIVKISEFSTDKAFQMLIENIKVNK